MTARGATATYNRTQAGGGRQEAETVGLTGEEQARKSHQLCPSRLMVIAQLPLAQRPILRQSNRSRFLSQHRPATATRRGACKSLHPGS